MAVGLSSLVMNLIGIQTDGASASSSWRPVGTDATMTYACNDPGASEEVRAIRSELLLVGISRGDGEGSHIGDAGGGGRNGDRGRTGNSSNSDLDRLHRDTGAPLHSSYALPQLRHLYNGKSRSSEIIASEVDVWTTISSLCVSRWTGAVPSSVPISYSEASWTGLLNIRSCRWDRGALNLLPEKCVSALPSLSDFDGFSCDGGYDGCEALLRRGIREVNEADDRSNPYWDRWPELRGSDGDDGGGGEGGGCRLFLGVGDGACANIGSKCSSDRRIAVTVGTSAAARVVMSLPLSDNTDGIRDGNSGDVNIDANSNFMVLPGLFCYRIDRRRVLLGGALTDGGSAVEWARSILGLSSEDDFQKCSDRAGRLYVRDVAEGEGEGSSPASALSSSSSLSMVQKRPPVFAPFLGGERSTGYRSGATGSFLGLTRDVTRADILRSTMEGVTLRIGAVLRLVRAALVSDGGRRGQEIRIVASGAALERSALWRAMLADCSGLTVITDAESAQGTSRGAATLVAQAAGRGLGGDKDDEEPLVVLDERHPRPGSTSYWERTRMEQERSIEAVSVLWEDKI